MGLGMPVQTTVGGPETWVWPAAPELITIVDKYSNESSTLALGDEEWTIVQKATRSRISFASGAVGHLQRRLVFLAHARSAPSTMRVFATVLTQHWETLAKLLQTGPDAVREDWKTTVQNTRQTAAFKSVLKLACRVGAGPWAVKHLALVESLDTLANPMVRERKRRLEGRNQMLQAAVQAQIVKVLNCAAEDPDLSGAEIEGAAALALLYQHGMRPVQVICLDVTDVDFFSASGSGICVVTFHAAKQRGGKTWAMARQVKPEWAALIARLYQAAEASDRARLFRTRSITALWDKVQIACRRFDVELPCSAIALRHTAAQTLADAGHSRESLQSFLGHSTDLTARSYIKASLQQAELINAALGVSRLYTTILDIAKGKFAAPGAIEAAASNQQIGGLVGSRVIAGLGICASGQNVCPFNPITSCYGCPKFLPSLDRDVHFEAVDGMRDQVAEFLARGSGTNSGAYRQLSTALARAQMVLKSLDDVEQKYDR